MSFVIPGTSLFFSKDGFKVHLEMSIADLFFCHGTKLVLIVSFRVMYDKVVTVLKVMTLKG